jgi:hypothetical protein
VDEPTNGIFNVVCDNFGIGFHPVSDVGVFGIFIFIYYTNTNINIK